MLGGGFRALCCGVVLAGGMLMASAQSTMGSIRGVANDSTGAAIPGSTATLRSMEQGTAYSATSDGTGSFVFENLKPGKYLLRVTHDGFAPTILKDITLDARQDLRVTTTLNVSSQATSIDVTTGPD